MEAKIISHILDYVPLSKVKTMRLVSHEWNIEACKILQRKESIEFHHVGDLGKYVNAFRRTHLSSENCNAAITGQPFPLPYAKFHFFGIRMNLIHFNYLLRTFFKRYVGSITHLEMEFHGSQFRLKYLRMCVLENIKDIKSVAFTFKEFYDVWPASLSDDGEDNCPPLCCVRDLTIYGFGREATLKSLLYKILRYFPSVERIEAGEQIGRLIFDIAYANGKVNSDSILDSNDCLRYPTTFPLLSHIDFHYIYPAQIDSIIQNKIMLKSLRGELHLVSEGQLQSLLEHLSSSVEELCLTCHSSTTLNFPTPRRNMTVLRKLELTKFTVDFSSFQKTPALRILQLKMVHLVVGSAEFCKNNVNEVLTSLSLDHCDVNAAKMEAMLELFPNVRALHLPFFSFEGKNLTIESILMKMPKIEKLYLSFGYRKGDSRDDLLREMMGTNDRKKLKCYQLSEELLESRTIQVCDNESLIPLGRLCIKDQI